MIREIIMPKLGETMEEGYLSKWLKKEGERIRRGEVILEVMSDKTNFEVESQYDGYLRKVLVEPSDQPIPVTTVIGYISDSPDEPVPDVLQTPRIEPEKAVTTEKIDSKVQDAKTAVRGDEKIRATPIARKIASEHGIDLASVVGTGPQGRIERKDVENFIARASGQSSKVQATEPSETIPFSPLRKIIAERLTYSKQNIPHYYLSVKLMVEQISKIKEIKKAEGVDATYTDFLIFLTARLLVEFPLMNAAVEGDRIRLYKSVDVGVAVGIEEGLVVPVIRGAAEKNLVQISNERRDLAERARTGKLKKEEIENCRFVISNLGMYGVTNFQAIINAPGTAILAVGAIQEEPIVDNGLLKAGKTMWVTLSLDHRVIDGAYGGKFLQRLKSVVENPGQIYL